MTARVGTAWYRPPELWAPTMDDHLLDADHDDNERTPPYGSSLDVWSFGAVVYEALSGQTLAARAANGKAMAQALAEVIGPCPSRGPGALAYTRNAQWTSWAATTKKPAASRPLPDSGAEWDLVRTCLRWDPSARVTMASAKQCAWFVERVAAPEAAPTSQTGTCADASTLSTETSRKRVHAWLQTDLSPPATKSSETPCSCKRALPLVQAPLRGQVRLH